MRPPMMHIPRIARVMMFTRCVCVAMGRVSLSSSPLAMPFVGLHLPLVCRMGLDHHPIREIADSVSADTDFPDAVNGIHPESSTTEFIAELIHTHFCGSGAETSRTKHYVTVWQFVADTRPVIVPSRPDIGIVNNFRLDALKLCRLSHSRFSVAFKGIHSNPLPKQWVM